MLVIQLKLYCRVQLRARTKREPSSKLKHSSMTISSSLPSISEILPPIHLSQMIRKCAVCSLDLVKTHFFMTSMLTFFMSTFWLNSIGNFVDLSSFVSTLDAMMDVRGAVKRLQSC